MPTTWSPELVSPDLLDLTHTLGEPARDLAVLAEGNTSELLDDGRLVVKASGANLASATAEDFVVVDVAEVMAVVESPDSTQSELSAVLVASDGVRRASIETVVHAAVHAAAGGARFIGHTHPTDVVGLLASVRAKEAWQQLVYSDEAVVVGRPLFVPYASPGLALGRTYLGALRSYVAEHDALPQLVLLANHGIVAIAPTAVGVEAVSTMAVKGALVRATAYAVGGLAPLTDEQVTTFFARDDIAARRTDLAYGRPSLVEPGERPGASPSRNQATAEIESPQMAPGFDSGSPSGSPGSTNGVAAQPRGGCPVRWGASPWMGCCADCALPHLIGQCTACNDTRSPATAPCGGAESPRPALALPPAQPTGWATPMTTFSEGGIHHD
ncbi:class II aldolase/adducin family protein [Luteipulveratus mongoliensis]|uniref:class II aldolase/adducin family protein n=1 Tax=Luteipulveratus mongoliensis TaxID=571913 RepID=UPI0009F8C568|nr:class II aldolase/adducin family protein [Luteipulveratus mongoliensis]